MIVLAHWTIVDHGTYSLYEMAAEGQYGYGVWNGEEWMVLDSAEDAREYASML